jgi:hypothetical protein
MCPRIYFPDPVISPADFGCPARAEKMLNGAVAFSAFKAAIDDMLEKK